MIMLTLPETGQFMKQLLTEDVFDKFYLYEGEVTTFAKFRVDGSLCGAYFDDDEKAALGGRVLALWGEVKPYIFRVMQGKKLPAEFGFVLQLNRENTEWLLEKSGFGDMKEVLTGFNMNIRYREGKLFAVSGVSYSAFVPGKALEQLWDETLKKYLSQNGIIYTEE
ncbi:MAG: DUF5721 family protein [Lachnospiraceae bacterium]|nr:DUF5721 family protein [Lachnospiraceae bacterium]